MVRFLSYGLVGRIVGAILLTAAALKLQGLAADPVARMGVFATPEFQLAVVQFEVFLGLWLLSGIQPVGSWLAALATFLGFAAVSGYQGVIGQTSCGCFGRLSVSPWYAFALDLFIIMALGLSRPDLEALFANPRRVLRAALLPAIGAFAGILLIGTVLLGTAHVAFGSVPAALAYFRGERVSVAPRLADVGISPQGESREVEVTLTNWTDQPIQVFGGTADCSCTVLDDLPVTIPARESRSVSVAIRLSGRPGVFTRKAGFLIDDGGFKRVDFRLTGQITVGASSARQ